MTTAEPKYTDVIEMSDDEFMSLRKEALKDRDIDMYGGEFSKDVWRRTYEYREIKYDLALLRYLSTQGNVGMNQYGKWFVLEYPNETTHIAELAKKVDEYREFLYRDTLHVWNDEQTLEQMFYWVADRAKEDIDWFLDSAIDEMSKIAADIERARLNLQKEIEKVKELNKT